MAEGNYNFRSQPLSTAAVNQDQPEEAQSVTWAQNSVPLGKDWVREEASDGDAVSYDHRWTNHRQQGEDVSAGDAASHHPDEEPFGRLGWQRASRTTGRRRQS